LKAAKVPGNIAIVSNLLESTDDYTPGWLGFADQLFHVNATNTPYHLKWNTKVLLQEDGEKCDDCDYFFYEGSLSMPPCSEVALWHVMMATIPISERQLNMLRCVISSTTNEPMNFNYRPVQPANFRDILQHRERDPKAYENFKLPSPEAPKMPPPGVMLPNPYPGQGQLPPQFPYPYPPQHGNAAPYQPHHAPAPYPSKPTTSPDYLDPTAPPRYQPTASPRYQPTASPDYLDPTAPSYQPTASPDYQDPTAPPRYQPTASPDYLDPTAPPRYQPTASLRYQPTASPDYLDPTASPRYQPTAPPRYQPTAPPRYPQPTTTTETPYQPTTETPYPSIYNLPLHLPNLPDFNFYRPNHHARG